MTTIKRLDSRGHWATALFFWGLLVFWGLLGWFSVGVCTTYAADSAEQNPTEHVGLRERLSLDRGWMFHLGDIPFPKIQGMRTTYESSKTGHAQGAASPGYDDSDWRQLDLPHDWAVEGPFDPQANLAQGYRPRGVSWYRRYFRLEPTDQGKHLELQFDGVATHCVVWVNGILVHRNWSGYNSFTIDITPYAQYGEQLNSIALRVDATPMEGWWYEGAGIYRHAWLVKREPVHFDTDGVYANPVRLDDGTWKIPFEASLSSCAKESMQLQVQTSLVSPGGKLLHQEETTVSVDPLQQNVARLDIPIESPQLWSVDDPALYEVRTIAKHNGRAIDNVSTRCGFRTLRFDPDQGFFLNDQPLKIKGVCNHQDHAGVGVAVPDSLWEYRIRRLQEMGANAYRCSHHPPAAEFLDACDRMGMLVLNENRNFNTSPEFASQLEWLVRRDRNHPSVILWSIFNEEPMQGTIQGFEMARRMVATVKQLDTTRPVTAAQSNSLRSPVNASQATDVAGFNYQHSGYDAYHAENPTIPIISTEDTSVVMTRGEYATDRQAGVLSSYGNEFQPWGATHWEAWKAIANRPYVAGGFAWTGFDYHGEPQPLEWPAIASSFGSLDLCGFAKAGYYVRQSYWIEDRPILHLLPHWNWSGFDNGPIKVKAITNAESVSLSLNGRPLGEKQVRPFEMVSWEVPYEPGILEAIAMREGNEIARSVVETTGPPAALELIADRSTLLGDGRDAQPLMVRAVDSEGRVVPNANMSIRFSLTGPGKIIGLGNGDPTCHEPEKGNQRSLFHGLAQAIIQSDRASSGQITVSASSEGLASAKISIEVTEARQLLEVPPAKPTFEVSGWRMSKLSERPLNPNWRSPSSGDGAWPTVQAGTLQDFEDGTFAIYHARFLPKNAVRQAGGRLLIKDVVGKSQVWLNGELAFESKDFSQRNIAVALPPGNYERDVAVLIEASRGSRAGLGGQVIVEQNPVVKK